MIPILRRRITHFGFTLIELMVVIGIIGILSSLILATASKAKNVAQRTACVSNLRQIGLANLFYADEDSRGALSPRIDANDHDVNWLFGRYIDEVKLFSCPSTRNYIRPEFRHKTRYGDEILIDLTHKAAGSGQFIGVSYLYYSFMGKGSVSFTEVPFYGSRRKIPNFKRKSLQNINSHRHHNNAFGLRGKVAGPSGIWLFLDNNRCPKIMTKPSPDIRADHSDSFPSTGDNHGAKGGNVVFSDGHANWVSRSQYLYQYELSEDEDRSTVFGSP